MATKTKVKPKTKAPAYKQQVFINLPVKDLEKSKAFFGKLGYTFNPQFTDQNGACMVISDTIFAMLLTEKFFKGFTKFEIADGRKSKEVLVALNQPSLAAVDAMADKAIAAGGKLHRPAEDHGWMYTKAIEDLDGHVWEIFWFDSSKAQQG